MPDHRTLRDWGECISSSSTAWYAFERLHLAHKWQKKSPPCGLGRNYHFHTLLWSLHGISPANKPRKIGKKDVTLTIDSSNRGRHLRQGLNNHRTLTGNSTQKVVLQFRSGSLEIFHQAIHVLFPRTLRKPHHARNIAELRRIRPGYRQSLAACDVLSQPLFLVVVELTHVR